MRHRSGKNQRAVIEHGTPLKAKKGTQMQEMLQPLIHKAAVHSIAVNVARTGLSIGDAVALLPLPDGRIGVFARLRRRFLGIIPHQSTVMIGALGPHATALIAPAVERAELLRVRIVGLTPEHLAIAPMGAEVHISVWGDPRHLSVNMPDGKAAKPVPMTAATNP